MSDIAAILSICALFAVAFAYVAGCGRLGGTQSSTGDQP